MKSKRTKCKLNAKYVDTHIWEHSDGSVDVNRFCDGCVTDIQVTNLNNNVKAITITHVNNENVSHYTTIFLDYDELIKLHATLTDFITV